MKERDLEPEEPASRPLVDELHTVAGQAVELDCDIRDLEGDVVHPRPALGEELSDGRVGAKRGKQLDPPAADAERRRLDTLLGKPLPVFELSAEQAAVRRDGRVQILDGDPDMMDAGHGTDAIGA